jgi:hypothetical protein
MTDRRDLADGMCPHCDGYGFRPVDPHPWRLWFARIVAAVGIVLYPIVIVALWARLVWGL